MKPSDIIRWGLRGIRQRKLRAALTVLGIMVGTAAVVALVSQTEGIQASILEQVNRLGPNTISIRPSSGSVVLTQTDANRILQMPGVDYVVPIVTSTARVYGGGTSRIFTLVGIDSSEFDILISGAKLAEGRLYQPVSYSEVLIGSYVSQPQDLTYPLVTFGQTTTIEIGLVNPVRKTVQVIGVLEPYGTAAFISVDDSLFMSLKGAMALTGRSSYSALFVKANDADSVDYAVDNIKAIYGTRLNIVTVKQITQIVSTITGQLTVLLGAIAAISLFVAGLGIMNIMFVSVIERTREIGVLKALGFTNNDVLLIFLSEAAIMGVVGGALGILVGSGISYVIPVILSAGISRTAGSFGTAQSFSYTPIIRADIAAFVLLFAIAVALLAGFYPARRGSKMDPVVALRSE
ncbi:MAG: ABC transporter permease [Candidatus Verstraetearchaeota archaeon]|nr:ABC transporter permease [Candidatus Verstraetearchaeota archaeon]